MENIIEPNIHPILVHFAYALSVTAFISYLLAAFAPAGKWRDTLQPAANWMLAFGALAIIATIAAGFQAYYTVNHDTPSHAAMTTHRNWAVPSGTAILLLALWRWTARAKPASAMFITLLAAAALSLSVTAWWGGKIVYGYGLGVKSMPVVTGDGHDHEHGDAAKAEPNHENMDMTSPAADSHDNGDGHHDNDASDGASMDEHDNSDGHHDAMKPAADAPEGHDNSDGHHDKPGATASSGGGQDSTSATTSVPVVEGEPSEIVDAFATALRQGDKQTLERLMLPNIIIAEGGGTERSFTEYASHHMSSDMAFLRATSTRLLKRDALETGDLTTVISESEISGTYKDKAIHSRMVETMVLRRVLGGWRVAHIHWSSAPITGEHEH